jgi:hypothetical protein
MGAVAVGLHDHLLRSPQEVDGVWADPGVWLRVGEAVAATEAAEVGLEARARAVGLREVADREPAKLGLTQGPAVFPLGADSPEVHERSGRLRDRDVELQRCLAALKGGRSVDDDAPALGWAIAVDQRNMGRSGLRLQKSEQHGRASVTQHSAFPGREDGRHPLSLNAQATMTDRVDPAVNRVQASLAYPIRDAAPAESLGDELLGGDDAMQSRRHCRNPGSNPVVSSLSDMSGQSRQNALGLALMTTPPRRFVPRPTERGAPFPQIAASGGRRPCGRTHGPLYNRFSS